MGFDGGLLSDCGDGECRPQQVIGVIGCMAQRVQEAVPDRTHGRLALDAETVSSWRSQRPPTQRDSTALAAGQR